MTKDGRKNVRSYILMDSLSKVFLQAKKIRVPGKLIELLRSDIPISEKRKYLDQLTIRYIYYRQIPLQFLEHLYQTQTK